MPITTPEQAQFIRDLRIRIQANKDAGVHEYYNIPKEELREFISILRSNRQLNAEKGSKKGGIKATRGANITPPTDEELTKLFS